MASFLAALLLLVAFASAKEHSYEDDRVTFLPGVKEQPKFGMYSGYIKVEDRNYHYWFLESQNDKDKDPVALWLNGGPGCDSLLGLLTENGAWLLSHTEARTLIPNPNAFNKNASMLYLETPSPVGFSFGGNETSGDGLIEHDNYFFLQGFFERFPHLRSHDFYISGESYAGIYIPDLANRILIENAAGQYPAINLKGFMVGNPSGVSSSEWEYSSYNFLKSHGLLSDEDVHKIAVACNYSASAALENSECAAAQLALWESNLKGINPYNILAPCVGNGPGFEPGCFTDQMMMRKGNGQTFVPCGDYSKLIDYLNWDEVKKALHVAPEAYEWTPCSEHLTYNQFRPGTPDLYRKMKGQIRMLVFAGDIDSCVPFLGTRRGVERLGFKRLSSYLPWFFYQSAVKSDQIGGYMEHFDGVSFTTVKNSGHMTMTDQGEATLTLFNSFLFPHASTIQWP